jgi:hypothetical protein
MGQDHILATFLIKISSIFHFNDFFSTPLTNNYLLL